MHLFCFGLGYVSSALAKNLKKRGWKISGTCRTEAKKHQLEEQGFETYIFDSENHKKNSLNPDWLEGVTHILHSVQPRQKHDLVYTNLDILNALETVKWFGYLSTTGVYGDTKGNWVNEESAVEPYNERLKYRIDTEKFIQHNIKAPSVIFRLSGIYGPGRNILLSLKRGKARRVYKPGQVFNRIHLDDIITIILASIDKNIVGEIFNCSDDFPAPSSDVVEYGAYLIGFSPPEMEYIEYAELSQMAQEFYNSCRRVKNDKVKEILGVELRYANYKLGLESLMEDIKTSLIF